MKIENVVVISLSDYEEYQNLKKQSEKPKINFSRLKTGSVVKLYCTGEEISGYKSCDFNKVFEVVLINSNITYCSDKFYKSTYKYNITAVQDGKLVSFGNTEQLNCITEVISY